MPIKRREIRESAFLLIFEKMFRQDEELDDIFMSAMEVNEIIVMMKLKSSWKMFAESRTRSTA